MAAVLSMSMVFSSLAAEKLEAPTVFWSEEREALPQWSRVENAAGQYQVEAYKDDTRIYNSHHTFSANDKSEILSAGGFISYLEESGIYKFRIMSLGDGNNTENSDWSSFSDNWSFTKANVTLDVSSNLHWEGTTACWDALEIPEEYQSYLLGYDVVLYADGNKRVTHHNIRKTSMDQADYMDVEGAKEYTFSVRAISNTPSVIFHGAEGKSTDIYNAEDTKADVSGTLDDILKSENTDAVINAPDALKGDIKDLQVAMQSDTEVLNKIDTLERLYYRKTGVKLKVKSKDVSEFDTGKVVIVGAVLNAAGSENVIFNISKPDKASVVDETAYKNSIQFDFSLQNAVSELKVPVRISVPIPDSINPKFFRILHDHKDGKGPVEINPLTVDINTNVTPAMASFTVTSFSTFIFAEAGADFEKIATPSIATEFMNLAKALPDSLDDLETEEQEGVETALLKLMAALKNTKINTSIKNDLLENEEVLLKVSTLLHGLGGKDITSTMDEGIERVMYFSPASGFFGTDELPSMHFNFDLATPSNAREKLVFNISMELDGEETIELLSPMKFHLAMPKGYTYSKNDTITVSGGKAVLSYDKTFDCLVVFTTRLGTFKITRSGSGSSGSSSSSGGNSKSSSTPHLPPKSPAGGRWAKSGNNYMYYYSDGLLASNCWLEITWNNTTHWYHFSASGIMDTGWIKDNLGNWYYLNVSADKVYGSMVTGWNLIDGKWYYFNEKSDGFKGTLLTDTTTPDGYQVDADGVWIH